MRSCQPLQALFTLKPGLSGTPRWLDLEKAQAEAALYLCDYGCFIIMNQFSLGISDHFILGQFRTFQQGQILPVIGLV